MPTENVVTFADKRKALNSKDFMTWLSCQEV